MTGANFTLVDMESLYQKVKFVGPFFGVCLLLFTQLFGDRYPAVGASEAIPTQDVFERKKDEPTNFQSEANKMSPDVEQLEHLLKLDDTIEQLKASKSKDSLEVLILRQKLDRTIQYAALELEEALANIDGDLTTTNMQLSFFSDRHDRAVALGNLATFVTSGTLGVLDSGTSINMGPPLNNILGITGNSASVGIPLLAQRPPKYKNPKRGLTGGNMLAPIFGRPYSGAGYDPIIWEYLESVPANSKNNLSRRNLLLKTWESYRGLQATDPRSKELIDAVTGVTQPDKISLNVLKVRSELLVDLRALVQQMYRDISDLNTSVLSL